MNNDAIHEINPTTRRRLNDIFIPLEIKKLTKRSNWMGFWAILSTWAIITVTFVLMAWSIQQSFWIATPVCIFGVALLGGRQLALAICTHEAAHRTLFASRWLNDWPTDWLCGRPIGLDLKKYRDHHFIHHTKTGTENDPDISLIEGLPTTKVSLARKFARDLVGVTGLKFIVGRVLMDAGLLKWTVASKMTSMPHQTIWQSLFNFIKNFTPTLITNLLLYLVLAIFGHPELYLFWILAYIIPYPLFIRIRALAEHACTERSTDMFLNTRTTRAGIIARAFFAPLNVNYHIEHHAMASVPWHNLPEMHRLLREKNIVDSPPSYWDVLIIVSSKSNSI